MVDRTQRPTPNHHLRRERERRCWSQQEVADMIGTTPLNIGRWERGITTPGPHFRRKLSEVFEKTPKELGLVVEKSNTESTTPVAQPASSPVISTSQTTPLGLWNVPYRRNLFFTGREEILASLRQVLLAEEQPIALAQPQAISGLGGIGKTQTVIEYAYRYRDNYNAVLWARADSRDLLISDFLTIASLLNLPERNEQDQNVVVKAVIRWFDTHDGWLLILDNGDDVEMTSEFIPSAGKGHVLLTTRAQSMGTFAQRIEIEKMELDEGILFLLRRAKRLKGATSLDAVPAAARKEARAIVEAVDGLPLALDQAGAYIEETSCSLSDYLKFYKTRRTRLLRARGRDVSGHPEPVAATWSLSFEKVERANPAAAELLRLCAFLHPDEIPESIIKEGVSELNLVLQSVVEDEFELNEAIGELHKYSLVKRDPEKKILNIHRLVQTVIRDEMDKDVQRARAELLVKMVNKAFPNAELATWEKCQQYSVHAQVCAEFIVQWRLVLPEAPQLLAKIGNYFVEHARYTEAEQLLQRALAIREQILKQTNPDVAQSLRDLAVLHMKQGKYEEGERLHRRALALRENIFGLGNVDVAQSLNDMAWLYLEQGKIELVEPLLRRALTIREQALGPEHHYTTETLSDLAFLYYRFQGRYQEAEALLRRVVAIYEQSLGPDHPDIAGVLHNLGGLYYRFQGRYQEAEALLRRVVAIYEQSLGPDHPDIANALNSLGDLYRFQGRYQEAEPLFQQSLAIYERRLGPDHLYTSAPLHNLAILYNIQGRYQEAEVLEKRSLAIMVQVVGYEHPDSALGLLSLASLYKSQERYQEAEPLYQRALATTEKALGQSHPEVAKFLERYAELLKDINRGSEAAALEARAQAIRAKHKQRSET